MCYFRHLVKKDQCIEMSRAKPNLEERFQGYATVGICMQGRSEDFSNTKAKNVYPLKNLGKMTCKNPNDMPFDS